MDDNIHPIGSATKTNSGVSVGASQVYAITKFAEDPDICFELIKSFFVEYINDSEKYICSLKTPVMDAADRYVHFLETEAGDEQSKEAEYFTEEGLASIYDLIDNAGTPYLKNTPRAIEYIVEEEISTYLAGVGTAESCADKIQSRVKIWLSEHE